MLTRADLALERAVICVDREFGKGYAEQHPELLGALIQSDAMCEAAEDIATAIKAVAEATGFAVERLAVVVEELGESLASAITKAERLRT